MDPPSNRKRTFLSDRPTNQLNIKIDPPRLKTIDEFWQANGFSSRSAFILYAVDQYIEIVGKEKQIVSLEEQVLGILQGAAAREKLREIMKDLVFEQAFKK